MTIAIRTVGILWILEGVILSIEEIMRVVRGEHGVSLMAALLLYAVVVAVGVYIFARIRGWTLVGVVAALYQAGTHLIHLSNVWPRLDYSGWFSLFVLCLAFATMGLAVVSWTKKQPDVSTTTDLSR